MTPRNGSDGFGDTPGFSDYLAVEWKPALGCTEPASIALAAANAASLSSGEPRSAHLVCDARIYKNCYAVGIPHSDGRTGILWSLAIGCFLTDLDAGLECFRGITPEILEKAGSLVRSGGVTVEVDPAREGLFVGCRVTGAAGSGGRAVIEGGHTRIVRLERDGDPVQEEGGDGSVDAPEKSLRRRLAGLTFHEMITLARSLGPEDAAALRKGVDLNLAIARHGLGLFPRSFVGLAGEDPLTRLSRLVLAGVHARMSGEDFVVMSLAGSGNKGITCSVPLALWGEEKGYPSQRVDQALALACLVTSATTHHLGTLSAVCGCSNAAGIGLAAGLVFLEGGDAEVVSMAMNNMVGNVAGMICDGAKIGCALKTMTSVDAAFRSASLAHNGICIPFTDGIIGKDGARSLRNLGRIATTGMTAMDDEILAIMQEKLHRLEND